jgi:hypothetical protein
LLLVEVAAVLVKVVAVLVVCYKEYWLLIQALNIQLR